MDVLYIKSSHVRITMNGTMKGTVAKKTDKGFGFIRVEGREKDLFFHSNSLVGITFDEVTEGMMVSFDEENSPKGPNAVNVQRA